MKNKGVDIRDVAALAGVSIGSASRVINGAENVLKETREKVERAVAILGYRPNHVAQSLRSRATKTIGCLLPDVANPLYAPLLPALEDRLGAHGYMMLLASSRSDPQREAEAMSLFQSRGMDGAILVTNHAENETVRRAMAALRMPGVVIDREVDAPMDI